MENRPTTSPIQYGATAVEIGSATVTRTADGDQDVIVVEFTVPGGFHEAHLCVATEAFAARVPPGRCPHKVVAETGQEVGRFEVRVEPDEAVHLQLHIVVGEETAYAGWTAGKPFFGNIEVPAPPVVTPVLCPEGMEPEGGEIVYDDEGEPTNCVRPVLDPVTCPDGTTPMTDVNDDDVIDADDCPTAAVLPEVVVPVEPLPVRTPEQPVTPRAPVTPATPATPVAAPLAPVPSLDALPGTEVAPTVVTVDNPQVTAVLGDQVVAGSLPRTGAATPGLVALGALLLAAGAGLTRTGRRLT